MHDNHPYPSHQNHQDHYPVMLPEVLQYLAPCDGGVYVDATFGAGGYSRAILTQADCKLYALDRDKNAMEAAQDMAGEFGDRFTFISCAFSQIKQAMADHGVAALDGVVLDIGVSSMQIDHAERGFSFQKDGPLDMRMDQDAHPDAAALIADLAEEDLAHIIWKYGEERHSRKIARAIVMRRGESPIITTLDLADIVRKAVPGRPKPGHDKATKTFQALRIAVNDELGELEQVLDAAQELLKPEGRLVVVTFHSLEDRIVKSFMRDATGYNKGTSRHVPGVWHGQELQEQLQEQARFELLSRKAVLAGEEEIAINQRSRSAKLRAMKHVGGVYD